MTLTGKTAVVTGASSSIGEATARLFAQERCNVVLAARREDRLNSLAAELGEGAPAVPTSDVTDPAACEALVSRAVGASALRISSSPTPGSGSTAPSRKGSPNTGTGCSRSTCRFRGHKLLGFRIVLAANGSEEIEFTRGNEPNLSENLRSLEGDADGGQLERQGGGGYGGLERHR